MKLIIEIYLDKVHRDTFTHRTDMHEAAKLVESAADRVRGLESDADDLLSGSWRIKDGNGATVGSVTVGESDDDEGTCPGGC